MSTYVEVNTSSAAYRVVIGRGLLDGLGEAYCEIGAPRAVAIITDDTVDTILGDTVRQSLSRVGISAHTLAVPAGEKSKSWQQAGELLERMADIGLDRASGVVALGGGVVGDLAGFCAATYMRGIEFVQVPTTLLAQVDSSVGGKTAVDLEAGKNLAGAFCQPRLVLADTSVLGSLPEIEWHSGLAEVVKSGILDSESLMSWMETSADGIVDRDPDIVERAVRACVSFKARVVGSDERETGARESLNYGHTLGHAIEKVLGYGSISHGQAVADGIRFAARLAERLINASPALTARQAALLDAVGLSDSGIRLDVGLMRNAIMSDKKARGGVARFVLVPNPGTFEVVEVDGEELAVALEQWSEREGA